MPRKTQKQEQTGGPINPQMQYVEEQQFISQEMPERVGQAANQYKTIFGQDAPSAFQRQPTGMENLVSIIQGSAQIIDSAGRTFETAVDIDKQKDARMAEEIEMQMKAIDADPNLTPTQKQWAKFDLQGQAMNSSLRPETKTFFKYSQDITMHNVEFLDDAENFQNQLLEFNKKSLDMTPVQRLREQDKMFNALESQYPAMKETIKEMRLKAEENTYALIWKENAGKSSAIFSQYMQEVLQTPTYQDPAILNDADPLTLYNATLDLMRENDASEFIPEEDNFALKDMLVTASNEALFAQQSAHRLKDKYARLNMLGAQILSESESNHNSSAWALLELHGVHGISQLLNSPGINQREAEAVGKTFKKMLYDINGSTLESPDQLLLFYKLMQYNERRLDNAEEAYGPDSYMARLAKAIEFAEYLQSTVDKDLPLSMTPMDLHELKSVANETLNREFSRATRDAMLEEEKATQPSVLAANSFNLDYNNPVTYIERTIAETETENANAYSFEENTRAQDAYIAINPLSNNARGQLQELGNSASRAAEFLDFQMVLKNNKVGYLNNDYTRRLSKDVSRLQDIQVELAKINSMSPKELEQTKKQKDTLVKDFFEILNRRQLKVSPPKQTNQDDRQRMGDLNNTAEGISIDKPFISFSAPLIRASSGLPKKDVVSILRPHLLKLPDLVAGIDEAYIDKDQNVLQNKAQEKVNAILEELNNEKTTPEKIITDAMALLEEYEYYFLAEPSDDGKFEAYGGFTKGLKDIKQSLMEEMVNRSNGEYLLSDNNERMIPNMENSQQYSLLYREVLGFSAEGRFDAEMRNPNTKNPAIRSLAQSVKRIATEFQADAKESSLTEAFSRIDPSDQAILDTTLTTIANGDSHLIPAALYREIRNGFIKPMLTDASRATYESFERDSDPLSDAILLQFDAISLSSIRSDTENGSPVELTQAKLNSVLAQFNVQGNIIQMTANGQPMQFSNGDPIIQGLSNSASFRGTEAFVTPDGEYYRFGGDVPLPAKLALVGIGLPIQQESLMGNRLAQFSDTGAITSAIAEAIYRVDTSLETDANRFDWYMSVLNSVRPAETVENVETSSLTQKGILLGQTLPAGSNIVLSFEPTGVDSNLRREGNSWIKETADGQEQLQNGEEVYNLLNREIAEGRWEVVAHYTENTNNVNAPSRDTPAYISFAPPVDQTNLPYHDPNNAMTSFTNEPARIRAESGVNVPINAHGRVVDIFMTD